MDGLQSLKSVRRNASRQGMSVAISSACLLLLSGCAFSRNLLNGPAPVAAPATTCTHPDCAAPSAATAPTMTAMPVLQGTAAAAQPASPMPQIPAAAQVPSNAAAGTTAGVSTPMPVPPVPAAGAAVSNGPAVPPGWKLVPDVPPAAAPQGFLTAQHPREQAECSVEQLAGAPVVWPADEQLLRCERQVAEMTEKITGLQNVTEVTKQAMISMELEQIRLRNENEALKRRADESHREVIKSIDSLSEYMDEIVPEEVPAQKPAPKSRARSAASPIEQTSVLPPVDEEL